ncbi:hypothetical protein AAZX31_08G288200 [Glycine max]|uniref:Uncharacterized protein n=2 Tax=Glycine subgen. Soja TaxID=1462606 RepID=K7L9S3_SOYBN|nr:hypothetical protein JHK87_022886 [Glycine soja]KAG5017341.1 hypothetical protein JHK85_023477 [Glycine max]KAG5027095.1 hypothetical protein JHK86_023009 [Glycine max]KAG5138235.1 hypothetical protein JHK82_022966 [Glycine max]KAH1053796.1 hypothetical protein GYH30_022844 [Glycine max]
MATRIIGLSFFLGFLCIALLFASGSAQIVCQQKGICPNTIACYNYCLGLGFQGYGRCDDNGLCCCKKG